MSINEMPELVVHRGLAGQFDVNSVTRSRRQETLDIGGGRRRRNSLNRLPNLEEHLLQAG